MTRALEGARTRWLVLAGVLLGLGFLTKMMQSFVVVPGFAAVYLLAAPATLRRRFVQLLVSGVAMFAAAAWWVAIVALWPAGSRPYIGGSQDNSILNLIFGYNGFGRITGNERGSVVGGRVFGAAGGLGGGPGNGSGMWGPTGITRLFGGEMGTQISWLLPAALFFLVVLLVGMWRAPRTDGKRAAVLLWGSWLLVTGLVFSFAQGIIHPYYTVALAPAIGALVGIGVVWTWARRGVCCSRASPWRWQSLGTAVWAFVAARPHAVVASGASLCGARRRRDHGGARSLSGRVSGASNRAAGRAVLLVALVAALVAPAAYSAETASTAHSGALPTAGPSGSVTGPGAGGGGARSRAFGRGGGPGFGFGPGAGNVPPGGAFAGATRWLRSRWRGRRSAGSSTRERRARRSRRCSRRTPRPIRWVAAIVGANSCSRRPARDERARDGDRRLQRHRSDPDPRAVRAVRRRGQGPLLHLLRRPMVAAAGSELLELERDHELGRGALHRNDGRRADGLRPEQGGRLALNRTRVATCRG